MEPPRSHRNAPGVPGSRRRRFHPGRVNVVIDLDPLSPAAPGLGQGDFRPTPAEIKTRSAGIPALPGDPQSRLSPTRFLVLAKSGKSGTHSSIWRAGGRSRGIVCGGRRRGKKLPPPNFQAVFLRPLSRSAPEARPDDSGFLRLPPRFADGLGIPKVRRVKTPSKRSGMGGRKDFPPQASRSLSKENSAPSGLGNFCRESIRYFRSKKRSIRLFHTIGRYGG